MPAILSGAGDRQFHCVIRDRSSSGAKLEMAQDRIADRATDVSVGDPMTLTIRTAQEQTSVACTVVWVSGSRCGVRFMGQFRSEPIQRRPFRSDGEAGEKAGRPRLLSSRLARS